MAVMGSIVGQHPEEIKKMFMTKKINKSGCYVVRVLLNGHFYKIVVDDYVPYNKLTKSLIYAGKKTKNVWPIILEKAWAKFNGSYEDIVTGTSDDAMKFLLPYPIERITIERDKIKFDEQWEKIKNLLRNR